MCVCVRVRVHAEFPSCSEKGTKALIYERVHLSQPNCTAIINFSFVRQPSTYTRARCSRATIAIERPLRAAGSKIESANVDEGENRKEE